jgi:hypothetical protein
MIKNEKQLLIVAIVISFLTLLIVSVFFLLSSISGLIFKSIFVGALLSIINFVIGLLLIKFSVDKSEKIFLLALWGGILFRLILGLSLVLITLIFLEINTYGFIFSILFFYVFYLLIEIFYLNLGRKSNFGGEQ